MLALMNSNAIAVQCSEVERAIRELGFGAQPVSGVLRTAICVVGNTDRVAAPRLERLCGVREVIHVTKPYKLVSREVHPANMVVRVGNVEIGGLSHVIVAAPCSVETEARTQDVAERRAWRAHAQLTLNLWNPTCPPAQRTAMEKQ